MTATRLAVNVRFRVTLRTQVRGRTMSDKCHKRTLFVTTGDLARLPRGEVAMNEGDRHRTLTHRGRDALD
jgi:hypothetical protein